eukprot:comp86257_c0_seq1/m.48466 comp86257_c0_seq1/g.48466  ORF comp86257_c0_seq1/g.48466 comp86257_c0_seq1/m.48466 type:complete len:542 (-) comp86257_c0_seq1:349-1974(-)
MEPVSKRQRVEDDQGGKKDELPPGLSAAVDGILDQLRGEGSEREKEEAVSLLWHAMPESLRHSFAAQTQTPHLNPLYHTKEFQAAFSAAYHNQTDLIGEQQHYPTSAQFFSQPFSSAVLPNFLAGQTGAPGEFLSEVIRELKGEHFNRKNNDLYDFHQTNDLKTCTRPHVQALCKMLYTEALGWMSDVMGVTLTNNMDLFCARYLDKGTLVCHDDQLEGRRIAFILYLVPLDWSAADGGALDLFAVDGAGYPAAVARSLVPAYNTLAFFEVSNHSFHQVAEVLTSRCDRMSIGGWFHGPPAKRLPPPPLPITPSPPEPQVVVPEDVGISLEDWLNPDYLKPEAVTKIGEHFVEQSSVQLQGFIRADRYEALKNGLENAHKDPQGDTCVSFQALGPPHQRHYSRGCGASGIVADFAAFLRSSAFWTYLSNVSNLQLARGTLELRKFGHRDYTLLHDSDQTVGVEALDVQYTCLVGVSKWDMAWGGFTSYLAGKDELLTVLPEDNTLSLVFRDEETMRFIKYLNHHTQGALLDFSLVLTEKTS